MIGGFTAIPQQQTVLPSLTCVTGLFLIFIELVDITLLSPTLLNTACVASCHCEATAFGDMQIWHSNSTLPLYKYSLYCTTFLSITTKSFYKLLIDRQSDPGEMSAHLFIFSSSVSLNQ